MPGAHGAEGVTPLFFFGTLRHPALIEAVIGDLSHIHLSQARLPGYATHAVREGPFPTLVQEAGAVAAGGLAEGLTEEDCARLDYYEAAFGYDLVAVTLEDGRAARAYMPPAELWTPDGPWSLADWAQHWGPMSVLAAEEVMSYRGERSPQAIAKMFPMIRARAWSVLNAQSSRHGDGTLQGQITVAETRRAYANYFALDELDLQHARFDGGMTDLATRAVFIAADATLVLPYDPVRDRVLLVEQMRIGPFARRDAACWQLEPIAGRLDPGETPDQAARREAEEEAGLRMGALHPVSESYASPGNSTEFFYSFVGIADLPDDIAGVGGLEAEQEDIRSHLLSFDVLMAMCDDRQIANTPLVMIAYWLARHRARLRSPS